MLLELKNVTKRYDAPEGGESLVVLNAINLTLGQGESVAVMGQSGSGKSTLLNIMGALDTPTRGEVVLKGKNMAGLSENALAQVRNRQFGFIFQMHHLLPQCTLLENVLVPTLADAKHDDSAEARARDLLKRVGLESRMFHRPGQLSGGECQRVAVVRALINQPKLLFADEPTGALDQTSARQLADLLVEVNREDKVALVVVTHWPELAKRLGHVYELREGTLVKM